ncbi:MAG: O-antigen ligase family protein [Acidobacteriota bacterium]|jgi:hypothetical protein
MILSRSRDPATRPPGDPSAPARAPALLSALPAVFALLFAAWCGTFYLGASAAGAAVAHGLVLAGGIAGCIVSGRRAGIAGLADPLELGRAGRFLLWAALAAVVLSWWASPVPRAGWVGVTLLPAFLYLPAAVAAGFGQRGPGRGAAVGTVAGPRALTVVVGGVSAWSLGRWLAGGSALPAEPLGQHLLLAAWVVTLLPLAALPVRERWVPSGPRSGVWSASGLVATALGVGAVLATRSVAGGLALVVEAAVGLALVSRGGRGARRGRARWLAGVLCGLALAAVVGGAVIGARRGDPSFQARWVYWSAGWAGLRASPWTGYGPGSTAWTLAGSLRPVPGVNPPGEVVGELHLLPLAVAYELGWPGLALALAAAGVFAVRRGRRITSGPSGADEPAAALAAAGLVGLAGAGVMGLATADWRVTALPVAAAVAAGAALAPRERPARDGPRRLSRAGLALATLYALAACASLVPVDRAHWISERALADLDGRRPPGAAGEPLHALDRALRLDPQMPLYRFHAARLRWLEGVRPDGPGPDGQGEDPGEAAREALQAAAKARGVAALWLRAGAAASAAGSPAVAAPAFELACSLDPLGAMAPFSLLAVGSPLHRSGSLGARALAAEPRLAAALFWEERPELLDAALDDLEAARGIDAGWREEMLRRVRRLPRGPAAGPVARVALVVDGRASDSLSLHAFRRLPHRVELVPVPVRRRGAEALAGMPPATVMRGTEADLFPATCTGPFAPQMLRKTLWKTR